MGAFDWTTYPIISHYGATDSEGNYWQPDVNVGVPAGFPITNLLPGTVTNVQNTSWGQQVVTVKLDQPVNSLATHEAYQHMKGSPVSPGQHLPSGAIVGYNNPTPPFNADVGYSLYPGDVYGSGPEWTQLQSDLAPGGAGLLKADNIIKQFASNQKAGLAPPVVPVSCGPLDLPCLWSNYILPFFEKTFIFIIAIILIVVGFLLIAEPQVKSAAKRLVA